MQLLPQLRHLGFITLLQPLLRRLRLAPLLGQLYLQCTA
jgi:hypothetical protein